MITYTVYSSKSGRNASAKSFDPGQPAQCSQADLGRNAMLHILDHGDPYLGSRGFISLPFAKSMDQM